MADISPPLDLYGRDLHGSDMHSSDLLGINLQGNSRYCDICGCVLILLFTALTYTTTVQAMWARMTDAELVESSQLIVMATYRGRADANLQIDGKIMQLGVLDVDKTLKGNQRKIIYLHLPQPEGFPHKSDDIFFHPGQKGLWFLREASPENAVYVIDHPQRFVPEDNVDIRLDSLNKLLTK